MVVVNMSDGEAAMTQHSETGHSTVALTRPTQKNADGRWLSATGGLLGAILASSCCLLPLLLTLFGISGAWMANLRALQPYKMIFVALAAIPIIYGFWLVHVKTPRQCAEDGVCARPLIPTAVVKTVLWLSALMVVASATIEWWFPIVRPYLP